MRVAIVVRLLWPGGVQRVAIEEARGLQRLGHKVTLIFLRESSLRVDYYLQDLNYQVIRRGYKKSLLTYIFRGLTGIYAPERGPEATIDLDLIIGESLKLSDFDVVIFHDQFSGIGGLFRKILLGEPYYLYIHETLLSRRHLTLKSLPPFLLEKEVIKNAEYVFTNSKANANALRRISKNVEVLYQGCYPKSAELSNVKKTKTALSVSLWDFGRKPEIYLEIARRLDVGKVVLAGSWVDPRQEDHFRKYIKRKGVTNLEVTGPISEEELEELYLRSRVFVRFGFHELGFGQGCLEAISYGLPIISNTGLGISEIVRDGIHGYVFEDINFDLVAERIKTLLTNDAVFELMKSNVIKLSKQLSWDTHVKRLNNILLNLKCGT